MDKMFLFYVVFSVFIINKVLASTNSPCQKGSLSCGDGIQCVLSEQWCDKNIDCDDGSDEAFCKESGWWNRDPNKCDEDLFLCSSGVCVPKSARCNDYDDCQDYSDEIGCDESTTEEIFTTETYSNTEATTESDKSSSEETSDSDESFQPDVEDEILVATPDVIKKSTFSTESPSFLFSSTQDYYRLRMKEIESSKQDISSSRISTPVYTTPSTKVTSSNVFIRTTSPGYPRQHPTASSDYPRPRPTAGHNYPRQRPTAGPDYPRQRTTARHYYPHQSQTYDRSGQNIERRPYQSPPQIYRPQTYDRRPSTYDRQHQHYDRRAEGYDRSSQTYGRHPQPYDRSSYDRRQQPYDRQSQNNRVQTYYNQSRPYDSRTSIFSNRIPHPSNNRHSTVNHNALNGEPDWIEVASLKPYSGVTEVNEPFHFAKNYAKIYGSGNNRHVREGENWILSQRNEAGDWGKDTARALVALALINNSFPSGNSDYELMKRRFTVQLSVALLRNSSNELQGSRLAMAMNALFAVCENPRDFHALDLTELLRIRIRETARTRRYPNPFVYLSLCLAGKPLTDSEVQNLMKKMTPPSGSQDEMTKDMQSLAIQAFSCHAHQVSSRDEAYRMSLREKLDSAVSELLSHMDEDGSFGSVYSTALAAQALLSVNDSRGWNAEKTINFLKQQQKEDGSFGDLLATYYTLPVLSGRSLLHLRNIQCTPAPVPRDLKPAEILEFAGPKQFIHYSIYFGYPLASSHSLRVLVPEGINFLDVMKVAEYQNKNFRFSYEVGDKNLNIYSISGTPNDVEQGRSWHLYVKNDADPNQKELQTNEQYNGDVREFYPTANKHIIYWYHPIGFRN